MSQYKLEIDDETFFCFFEEYPNIYISFKNPLWKSKAVKKYIKAKQRYKDRKKKRKKSKFKKYKL